jgi:hypothetical protein
MNDTIKSVLVVALILGIVFSVVGVIAITIWHGTVTWTIKSFSVYEVATGGSPLTIPYTWALDIVNVGDEKTKDFYIQNDTTVSITVNVINFNWTGCTASFNADSYTIAVGTRVKATLTLTVSGLGSCNFDFTLA